jgi:hypothetical protein
MRRLIPGMGLLGVAAMAAAGLGQVSFVDPGVRAQQAQSGKASQTTNTTGEHKAIPWGPRPWRKQRAHGSAGHPPFRRGKKAYSAKLKAKRKARRRRMRA